MTKKQQLLMFSFCCCCFSLALCEVEAPAEKRLRDDLLSVYNWTVRPVKNFTDRLYVYLRFRLLRVAELDVKDQILTLHAVIEHEWRDYKFQWDPNNYGGIYQINLPSQALWLPDLEMYNQFGEFERQGPFAIIYSDGTIKWRPHTVLRTFCPIEVRYYPFDIQTCLLTFGSWTHDGNLLYLTLKDLPSGNDTGILPLGMSLKHYYPSSEWDLLSLPGSLKLMFYPCCEEPYVFIRFNVTLRRHPHFYLVNLVMPLMGLSYLSLLVFYLPADSGEKITLCVSVLTSQVMFLLLMMDNIPVTSLAVPLLGKIIVFNMILVFLSVFCTTIVLNVYYRKPTTHKMPNFVRRLRFTMLPKILLIEAIPPLSTKNESGNVLFDGENGRARKSNFESRLKKMSRLVSISLQEIDYQFQETRYDHKEPISTRKSIYSQQVIRSALSNVNYIRNYMEHKEETNYECDDWKFLASILDRIFLIIFNIAFIVGTGIIMMDAPALYDNRQAVDKTFSSNEANIIHETVHLPTNNSDSDELMDEQSVIFEE